jgi:hypothetical protein
VATGESTDCARASEGNRIEAAMRQKFRTDATIDRSSCDGLAAMYLLANLDHVNVIIYCLTYKLTISKGTSPKADMTVNSGLQCRDGVLRPRKAVEGRLCKVTGTTKDGGERAWNQTWNYVMSGTKASRPRLTSVCITEIAWALSSEIGWSRKTPLSCRALLPLMCSAARNALATSTQA